MWFLTFLMKNLLRRKLRTTLTCFGVAVAVGTMVALLGVAHGFERASMEAFERRNQDIIVVEKGLLNELDSDLDETLVDRIAAFDGVSKLSKALIQATKYDLDEFSTVALFVQGWMPGDFLFDDLAMRSGRKIAAGDEGTNVAIIGVTLAEQADKSVGDDFEIEDEKFEIVGVFESRANFENSNIIVPLRVLQAKMRRTNRLTACSVVLDHRAKDPVFVQSVCDKINAIAGPGGKPSRFAAKPAAQYVDEASYVRLSRAMAWLTSAIAIIVGAIGMINTMFMSVVERVREISILRAIGWRRWRVIRMVVGESLILSVTGGIVGAIGAALLLSWLTTLPAARDIIQGTIAPIVFAKGILIALAIGLIGGTFPALRAAQLLPAEGLRHE